MKSVYLLALLFGLLLGGMINSYVIMPMLTNNTEKVDHIGPLRQPIEYTAGDYKVQKFILDNEQWLIFRLTGTCNFTVVKAQYNFIPLHPVDEKPALASPQPQSVPAKDDGALTPASAGEKPKDLSIADDKKAAIKDLHGKLWRKGWQVKGM